MGMRQMELKIEHGVPVPPPAVKEGNNIALLRSMRPGDSVFFDTPIAGKAVRFYRVAKKLNLTILLRKEKGGTRMWLVSAAAPARTSSSVDKVNGRGVQAVGKGRSSKLPRGHAKAGRSVRRSA